MPSAKRLERLLQWLPWAAFLLHPALAIVLGNRWVSYPDQDCYLDTTRNLLAGRGLMVSVPALDGFVRAGEPTSYYGAGLQLLLAGPLAVFGDNWLALRLFNCALFALTLVLFRALARLWVPPAWADGATTAVALSPVFLAFNQLFVTEMPFVLSSVGATLFFFRALRSGRRGDGVVAGGFVGFNLLVRSNLLPLVPLMALLLARRQGPRRAGLFALTALLIVAPYCARNCVNNRAFFPFDGKAAFNLWLFNASVHDGGFWTEDFTRAPPIPDLTGLTEKQRADLLTGIGLRWIGEHPLGFLRLSAMKAVRFFWLGPKTAENLRFAPVLWGYSLLLFLGFFTGLPRLKPSDPEHLFVLAMFLLVFGVDVVFMAATRHRMLYDPFFVLVGIHGLWRRTRGASSPAAAG